MACLPARMQHSRPGHLRATADMNAMPPPSPSRRQAMLAVGLAGATVTMAGDAEAAVARPDFTLLLVNDIYRMGERDGRGGFARLGAIVKAERARGVPLLFCHAGDCFSPSLMSGFDQGAHIVELLNAIGPDVFVPGNHEFDFGLTTYLKRMGEARFPFYAANMRGADGAPIPGMRDTSLHKLGPVTVGIVGLALADTPAKSQSGDLRFLPEVEVLRRETASLRKAGADLVVAVAHTDRPTDTEIMGSHIVEVLLSGHDHDLALAYDGKTVMVESSEEGNFVTAIDFAVKFAGEGAGRTMTWSPSFRIHDSAAVEPDPDVQAIVTRLERELAKELDVPLAVTSVPLDSRTVTVRAEEAAIGNLVADAMRASTGADIAITNGGGIRANKRYPAGTTLTRRDVLSELPFGNTTVLVEITGAQVKRLLENGAAQIGSPSGRFPQVSGLHFAIDRAAPAGGRVSDVTHDGVPLDMARTYRVGSNNFMLAGGDGYGGLADGQVLVGATDGKLVANEVMAYVGRLGTVTTRVEGRITIR